MLKFELPEDNEENSCAFSYESTGLHFTFDIPNPLDLSEEDFDALAKMQFEKDSEKLLTRRFDFDEWNGGQYIILHKAAKVNEGPRSVSVEFQLAKHCASMTVTLPFEVCSAAFTEAAKWRLTAVEKPDVVKVYDVQMKVQAVKDQVTLNMSWSPFSPEYQQPKVFDADGTEIDMTAARAFRPKRDLVFTLKKEHWKDLAQLAKDGDSSMIFTEDKAEPVGLQRIGDKFRILCEATSIKGLLHGGLAYEFDARQATAMLDALYELSMAANK